MCQSDRVGAKVRLLSNSFHRIANSSTSELGITASQSFLLSYIGRLQDEPPCQHDIEVRFNIKHPTATGILNRLAEKGFVSFAPDAYDKRMKRIVITDAGRSAAEQTKACLDEMENRLISNFSDEEVAELHRLLDKLVANACPNCCSKHEGDRSA